MNSKISVSNLNLYYGQNHALKSVNMEIPENEITAFIGPSGCGKSTFLKTLNRMNDLVEGVRIEGKVVLDGEDIYSPTVDKHGWHKEPRQHADYRHDHNKLNKGEPLF